MSQGLIETLEPKTPPPADWAGMDPMKIATHLRDGRAEVGMTRKQVHEATGIPIKTIEKYEYGKQEPSVSRIRALCDFYGLDFMAVIDDVSQPSHAKPLKTPAPASKASPVSIDVAKKRALLKQMAKEMGVDVYTTEDLQGSGSFTAPTVATFVDTNHVGADLSPLAMLEQLEQVSKLKGANSVEVKRLVRDLKKDIEEKPLEKILDLAEDYNLNDAPEDEMGVILEGNDESPKKQTTASLVARMLVKAVFGHEPSDLEDDALSALHEELLELLDLESDEIEDADSWGRSADDVFDCQQRIVAKLMLAALLKRQAPDMANDKAYPKVEADEEDQKMTRSQWDKHFKEMDV